MKNTVFCSHFPPIILVSQACAFSSVRQFLWYLPSYLHITWIYYSFFNLVIICSFFRLWRSWKSRISHFFPLLLTSLLCTTFSNPYSLSLTDYDYTIILLDESSVFSIQFSSVTQSCPTLCNPMNCSTPGLPVHHQLPESTQTYVHRVSGAIQPSHPLLSPFPPALNLSQHQGLFKWVISLH